MNFKPGDHIREELIVKRYEEQKTGHILLELVEFPDQLIRITEDGNFLYAVKKNLIPPDQLKVTFERQEIEEAGNEMCPDYLRPYLKKAFMLKSDEGIHFYDDQLMLVGTLATSNTEPPAPKVIDLEDSGDLAIPEEPEKLLKDHEVGDALGESFRGECIEGKEGYRLKKEDTLFMMDSDYKITDKLTLETPILDQFVEPKVESNPPPAEASPKKVKKKVKTTKKEKTTPPETVTLSPDEITALIMGKYKQILEDHQIQADYFVGKKLSRENQTRFLSVYNGDIFQLNEETATAEGELPTFESDGGLSHLKAALVHELYIHSTLAGRSRGDADMAEGGRNMKSMLTLMINLRATGNGPPDEEISPKEQKALIKYFGERANIYTDKTDVIDRIYHKIQYDMKKELLVQSGQRITTATFKALLVYKLYENTNRLDRGNGVSIIRIVRDIMDYQGEPFGESS